jgi:hypothetical protein
MHNRVLLAHELDCRQLVGDRRIRACIGPIVVVHSGPPCGVEKIKRNLSFDKFEAKEFHLLGVGLSARLRNKPSVRVPFQLLDAEHLIDDSPVVLSLDDILAHLVHVLLLWLSSGGILAHFELKVKEEIKPNFEPLELSP